MDGIPDIAPVAGLIGDRARASILMALMDGRSLTATELSRAANVSKQTGSSHLAKLTRAGLVLAENSGRHRYFKLASGDVAGVIEQLMGLAGRLGAVHVSSGPPAPEMRKARTCYDHLAGELGVLVFDSLQSREFLRKANGELALSESGEVFCDQLGIDLASMKTSRRPMCLSCLDWSARRYHLAGAVGAALLDHFLAAGWARVRRDSRVVSFSATGERSLRVHFPVPHAVRFRESS